MVGTKILGAKVFHIFLFLFTVSSTQSFVSKHFYDNSVEAKYNTPHRLETSQKTQKHNENKLFINTTQSSNQPTFKKWQVGRVSRKQYEIVNMLWRKTNIFIDIENTTIKPSRHEKEMNKNFQPITPQPQRYKFSLPRPLLQPKTSSYIEFYYLDETDELANSNGPKSVTFDKPPSGNAKNDNKHLRGFTSSVLRYPLLSFRINEPSYKRPTRTSSQTDETISHPLITLNDNATKLRNLFFINNQRTPMSKTNPMQNLITETSFDTSSKEHFVDYETCPSTTQDSDGIMLEVEPDTTTSESFAQVENQIASSTKQSNNATSFGSPLSQESTTVYDKIKFFEMYDTRTSLNMMTDDSLLHDDSENSANEINCDQKIKLEHVDQEIRHQDNVPHKTRYAKKHIELLENKAEEARAFHERNSTKLNETEEHLDLKLTQNNVSSLKSPVYVLDRNLNPDIFANMSRYPPWTEFPFTAVYVYERSQVSITILTLLIEETNF